ncbi:hypothetical protein AAA294_07490 [Fusobacterium varium]|uniref:hypothetical protein n=1 Tax=Fusobacterium varium TaxID=856 RepID=UPI0032C02DDA
MLEKQVIIEKLKICVEKLKKKDIYLIKNDGSERAIAHRLALYMEDEFSEYDVDCEYNINIEHHSGRKKIYLLEEEVKKYKSKHKVIEDKEVSILPDIIVHRRGENSKNILIIEIKKDTSTIDDEYDTFKLKKFTDVYDEDSLFYKLGCALKILTTAEDVNFEFYEEGKLMEMEEGMK